jgi:proline iminopeptidase
MHRAARRLLFAISSAAGVAALGLAAGYSATGGVPPVPRTVSDDPSLPQANVDGIRLHVVTFGDPERPPVVVVHGGPGNDSRYLLPLRELADRYFVVFYDQRGSGLSERVADDRLTLEGFYRELDGVVDRYGRGRPVRLIGHSWGAMLVAGYLGRQPDKVAQAVLAEPGMLVEEDARHLMEATNDMRPPLGWVAIGAAAKAWVESLHVRGPDADARRDHLMAALTRTDVPGHPMAGYFCGRDLSSAKLEGWRFGARAAPALFREARRPDGSWAVDFARGAGRFPSRVLFLAGSCNQVTGEARQRIHMRNFPSAELVVIEGAGHTMFGEKPEQSLAAVRRYFDEAAASPQAMAPAGR